jgi:hypothetical protein
MQITFAKTAAEAKAAMAEGAIPVECSFGSEGSIVDPRFVMDHHGEYSHLEGVALRAYGQHFGALREEYLAGKAHFVVTGAADADATFAIASLIGVLPHPSRAEALKTAPPYLREPLTRDISVLAKLVNQVDTAPIGVRLEESDEGVLLMLWNQMSSHEQDATSFYAGIDRWRALLSKARPALAKAVKAEEALRVERARAAVITPVGNDPVAGVLVAVVESEEWGFDVWYSDVAPVIVALTPQGNITVGVRDQATAEKLLGPGGLKVVFPKLGEGWGGREAIGGSPRGKLMTKQDAVEAAKVIASLV